MSYTYPHFASQSPAASYQSAHTITQYMEQRLGHSTHVVEDDEEAQISPSTSPSRHPRRMSYGSLPRRRSSGHLTDGRGRRMSYGALQAPDETAPLLSTPLNAATAFDTAFAGPLVDAVIDESDEDSDTETEGRTGGPKSQPHSTGATVAALGKEGKIIIGYSVPVLMYVFSSCFFGSHSPNALSHGAHTARNCSSIPSPSRLSSLSAIFRPLSSLLLLWAP